MGRTGTLSTVPSITGASIPLWDTPKETLDDFVQKNTVVPVHKPNTLDKLVPKKDGKLRICLDPHDFNRAIRLDHYPLPTIEDVATQLHKAKVFTVLDMKKGYWHVELKDKSSFLSTLNTPFDRYRWKKMPFGICSAPKVFQ